METTLSEAEIDDKDTSFYMPGYKMFYPTTYTSSEFYSCLRT